MVTEISGTVRLTAALGLPAMILLLGWPGSRSPQRPRAVDLRQGGDVEWTLGLNIPYRVSVRAELPSWSVMPGGGTIYKKLK